MNEPPDWSEGAGAVSPDLRRRILAGGAYLVGRQVLGMAISVGGIIAVTRLIGPAGYGSYAGALAIVSFFIMVGRLGVEVFLVRREQEPEPEVYHQATTLLAVWGLALAGVGILSGPPLVGAFVDQRFVPPLLALLPTVPVTLLSGLALARLDRALDFRAVALVELGCQIATVSVTAVLAVAGAGVWAPVVGYWTGQVYQVLRSHVVAGYRPRLVWSWQLVREMVEYGVGCSASTWIWQSRQLVVAFVVGRFLGPEGVAFINLATRLVEVLAFVKSVAWRLSIAALAKVQGNLGRLSRGMEEAMTLQVMGVGPALGGFALVAPWLVPVLFGEQWGQVLRVYPFIAFGFLVNAAFSMQSSVLYVLRRNRTVTAQNAVHVALLTGASLALVPQLDLWGYAVAEIVACSCYVIVHRQVTALLRFSYGQVSPWLVGFAPPLFAVFVPWPWGLALWLPLLVVVAWPRQRRLIESYARQVRWRTA